MTVTVAVSPRARRDLVVLHRWIHDAADEKTADGYFRRIDALIRSLRDFPDRGTPRPDIRSGMRTITFERRVIVAYEVGARTVDILRVVDARRDWPALLPR